MHRLVIESPHQNMTDRADSQGVLSFPPSSPANSNSAFHSSAPPRRQPFCGDPEGWGPISGHRVDFTPCFLDVWIAAVAAFGLVLGAGALWMLLRRTSQPVGKNWHFYAKLVW